MFRQIVLAVLAFIVIALVAVWFLGGGPRKVVEGIQDIGRSPFSPKNAANFRLPWQPVELFPKLDITEALIFSGFDPDKDDLSWAAREYADIEAEYERLSGEASRQPRFNNPSPFIGAVSIVPDMRGLSATDPKQEYVQIIASYYGSATIDITGWLLESALSGVRVGIPPAASPLLLGTANALVPVTLQPGDTAILVSAPSPFGVSYRENACTHYLPEAQAYNDCVARERSYPFFETDTWRMYLGASSELWRNTHDAIRLLDAHGRTVDVLVY